MLLDATKMQKMLSTYSGLPLQWCIQTHMSISGMQYSRYAADCAISFLIINRQWKVCWFRCFEFAGSILSATFELWAYAELLVGMLALYWLNILVNLVDTGLWWNFLEFWDRQKLPCTLLKAFFFFNAICISHIHMVRSLFSYMLRKLVGEKSAYFFLLQKSVCIALQNWGTNFYQVTCGRVRHDASFWNLGTE